MKLSTKVGIGYAVAGLIVPFIIGLLDLEHLKVPIWGALLGACGLTVYLIAVSEHKDRPPGKT